MEYLPNPTEVIEELNHYRVKFAFEDEKEQGRKRRATINRSQDSFKSDEGQGIQAGGHPYGMWKPLTSIPNERQTIQNELLDRLEALNGLSVQPSYFKPVPDDGLPRLGIYTQEERVERINTYREKRKKRVFGKVRYVLRQRASEGRARVKGRFAKETDPTSPASNQPLEKSREKSMEQVAAENLKDSTSWLEKMTLGASRRLSGSRKRASLPARPDSPFFMDDDDAERKSSWSSWLLKNRRKSSTSAASGRLSDGQTQNVSPAHVDAEINAFFVEQTGPDRKRLTSGSSALFNDIIFDPTEIDQDS